MALELALLEICSQIWQRLYGRLQHYLSSEVSDKERCICQEVTNHSVVSPIDWAKRCPLHEHQLP